MSETTGLPCHECNKPRMITAIAFGVITTPELLGMIIGRGIKPPCSDIAPEHGLDWLGYIISCAKPQRGEAMLGLPSTAARLAFRAPGSTLLATQRWTIFSRWMESCGFELPKPEILIVEIAR